MFPGRLDYATYVRLLQRSDAHVYLTYPFVASWSLREALAMGCAVVASDTPPVQEFIDDGCNGLLAPFLDPKRLAVRILQVMEDRPLSGRLREGARRFAEQNLSMADYLAAYEVLIARLTGAERCAASSFPLAGAVGSASAVPVEGLARAIRSAVNPS